MAVDLESRPNIEFKENIEWQSQSRISVHGPKKIITKPPEHSRL